MKTEEYITKLQERIAELEQIIEVQAHNLREANDRLEKKVLPSVIIKDAERWQEIMLEWGYGVHNGMGEFWEEVAKRMSSEEKKKAIDASMREGDK